jgi:hypothetical protein
MRFGASGADAAEEIATAATAAPQDAAATAWEFRRNEFWHLIVAALVAVAALEFVVGNRVAA